MTGRSRQGGIKALSAGTAIAIAALVAGCSTGGFEGTVRCHVAIAEVVFNPGERVEIRAAGDTVGWADPGDRGLDDEACERVATQDSWSTPGPYERATEPITLRCRFPGRFFAHTHPTYSSESGEEFPDGSALYLVAEEGQTIAASASIGENPTNSSMQFSELYCSRQ
jgi:hypothetical protein